MPSEDATKVGLVKAESEFAGERLVEKRPEAGLYPIPGKDSRTPPTRLFFLEVADGL